VRRVIKTLTQALALSLIGASAAAAAQVHSSPGDGFIYPGQSDEARSYNQRWDAHMKAIPPAPAAGDAELRKLDWMLGSWDAIPREFPSTMRDPADAEVSASSPARVEYTTGRKWLKISFVAQPWNSEWDYYVGHDRVRGVWRLQYISTPGLLLQPLSSSRWSKDRLVFGPAAEDYNGFQSVLRTSIVRIDADEFRIVNEVHTPSGKYVAMDDVLFRRRQP
jgi:hypothetical protein